MANLLPQKERKRFLWEYRFRLFTVAMLFFAATMLFGTILLLPSYFVSESKEVSILRQSELLEKTISIREGDPSLISLLSTKQKITALEDVQKQVLQSEVLQAIIKSIDENITVGAFYYTQKGESSSEMRITGVADSRSALLLFSDRLKKESLFDRVDFPVSSLAQDSDITFSMLLTGNF